MWKLLFMETCGSSACGSVEPVQRLVWWRSSSPRRGQNTHGIIAQLRPAGKSNLTPLRHSALFTNTHTHARTHAHTHTLLQTISHNHLLDHSTSSFHFFHMFCLDLTLSKDLFLLTTLLFFSYFSTSLVGCVCVCMCVYVCVCVCMCVYVQLTSESKLTVGFCEILITVFFSSDTRWCSLNT